MKVAKRVDLSQLSPEELADIGSSVLKNLAQRLQSEGEQRDGPTPIGPHDKHTSSHQRNSIVEEQTEAAFE